jgi:hypothetical protein
MAKYMLLLALIGKTCSVLFFFFSWFYYIPPKINPAENELSAADKYVKKEVEKY